jgi:hypothetical protein
MESIKKQKSFDSRKEESKIDKYGNSQGSTGNSDSDGPKGIVKKNSQGYVSHGSSKGSTKDRDHSYSDSANSKDSSEPNVS